MLRAREEKQAALAKNSERDDAAAKLVGRPTRSPRPPAAQGADAPSRGLQAHLPPWKRDLVLRKMRKEQEVGRYFCAALDSRPPAAHPQLQAATPKAHATAGGKKFSTVSAAMSQVTLSPEAEEVARSGESGAQLLGLTPSQIRDVERVASARCHACCRSGPLTRTLTRRRH